MLLIQGILPPGVRWWINPITTHQSGWAELCCSNKRAPDLTQQSLWLARRQLKTAVHHPYSEIQGGGTATAGTWTSPGQQAERTLKIVYPPFFPDWSLTSKAAGRCSAVRHAGGRELEWVVNVLMISCSFDLLSEHKCVKGYETGL